MSVEIPPPIKEFLLVFVCLLLIILLMWMLSSFKKEGEHTIKKSLIAILLTISILLLTFAMYVIENPKGVGSLGYAFDIEIINSSSDISIIDFSYYIDGQELEERHNTTGHPNYEIRENETIIKCDDKGEFDNLRIKCNKIPIFWGNDALELTIYAQQYRVFVYYLNSSGSYELIKFNENNAFSYQSEPLYYKYNQSWIIIRFHLTFAV